MNSQTTDLSQVTESNKAVVRRFNLEVIEQGKPGSAEDLMDSQLVNHSAPPGTDNGPKGMLNTFNNILRPALSDMKVTVHDQVAEGDKVTTRKSISGTHTGTLLGIEATGKPVNIDIIDVVRIKNGKYFEHWGVNTLPSVLQQLAKK